MGPLFRVSFPAGTDILRPSSVGQFEETMTVSFDPSLQVAMMVQLVSVRSLVRKPKLKPGR